jgi:hypothetical protein
MRWCGRLGGIGEERSAQLLVLVDLLAPLELRQELLLAAARVVLCASI